MIHDEPRRLGSGGVIGQPQLEKMKERYNEQKKTEDQKLRAVAKTILGDYWALNWVPWVCHPNPANDFPGVRQIWRHIGWEPSPNPPSPHRLWVVNPSFRLRTTSAPPRWNPVVVSLRRCVAARTSSSFRHPLTPSAPFSVASAVKSYMCPLENHKKTMFLSTTTNRTTPSRRRWQEEKSTTKCCIIFRYRVSLSVTKKKPRDYTRLP